MRYSFRLILIFLFPVLISGCASLLTRIAAGKGSITLPQLVAHLEPVLRENKILLRGDVSIQNPTESDLALDEIGLTIRDETNGILRKVVGQWDKPGVTSKNEIKAPIEIDLDLEILNKRTLNVFIQTAFTFTKLNIRIPVESKVAVIHLDFLKENIIRPLNVNVHTKFIYSLKRKLNIEYVMEINNPTPIDLLFDKGNIQIYFGEKSDTVSVSLPAVLFKANTDNQIKGNIDLEKLFKIGSIKELIEKHSLYFQLEGELRIVGTDIHMPLRVNSIQEVDFSLNSKNVF